jgi:hypothetical protein
MHIDEMSVGEMSVGKKTCCHLKYVKIKRQYCSFQNFKNMAAGIAESIEHYIKQGIFS